MDLSDSLLKIKNNTLNDCIFKFLLQHITITNTMKSEQIIRIPTKLKIATGSYILQAFRDKYINNSELSLCKLCNASISMITFMVARSTNICSETPYKISVELSYIKCHNNICSYWNK